jgi:ADP-ribose pyrophosphatase
MKDDFEETTLDSVQVFDGRLLKVRVDRVALPGDGEHVREYIQHPGAVMTIPVLDTGKLVFERQHRYPLRRTMIELPAGKIDPGESIEQTAARELREETGYLASAWRHLGAIHPCVGYSDERIEIFLARGLSHVGASLDHGERIEILELSLGEALEAVRSGGITDGKTVAGVFWAEKALRSDW